MFISMETFKFLTESKKWNFSQGEELYSLMQFVSSLPLPTFSLTDLNPLSNHGPL